MDRKSCIVASLAVLAGAVSADTAYWTNTANTVSQWGDAANWTDAAEGGNALALPPTNGENVVFAALPADRGGKQISTGQFSGSDSSAHLSGTAVNPKVGTISGGDLYEIVHGSWRFLIQKERPFVIGDPSGFNGYWTAGDARMVFKLAPGENATQTMSTLVITNRPVLDVASGTVELGEAMGRGLVHKRGAGTLKISGTSGGDAQFSIDGGNVTFDPPEDGLAAILAKAALHLDASAASTLTTTNGGGYDWVTSWSDVRGNGLVAVPADDYSLGGVNANYYAYVRPAYLTEDSPMDGVRTVGFGTCGSYAHGTSQKGAVDGPTNCVLKLNRTVDGIREALYVARTPHSQGMATILGSTGNHHFMAEGGMFADYAQKDGSGEKVYRLRKGEMRYNGVRLPFERFKEASMWSNVTQWYTMGLSLTADASVNLLGSREFYTAYSGGSRIGEVLLFTNVLTKAERGILNAYLKGKWLEGDADKGAYTAGNIILTNRQDVAVGVADGKIARVRNLTTHSGKLTKTGGGALEIDCLYPSNTTITIEGGTVAIGSESTAVDDSAPASNPWLWLDAQSAASDFTTFTKDELFPGTNYITRWKDCRAGVDLYAESPYGAGAVTASRARVPTFSTYNGKKVVDFGNSGHSTTHAWTNNAAMTLPGFSNSDINGVQKKSYAGFIALKQNVKANDGALFGSAAYEMYRFAYPYRYAIAGTWYVNAKVSSSIWTINGSPRDPIAWYDPDLQQNTRMMVIAFSSDKPLIVNMIAQLLRYDASDATSKGGRIQVGEMLLYDRQLSEAERRQTEAYLMRKWLDQSHPAAAAAVVPAISYPDGSAVVIGTEGNLDISNLNGGNGVISKTGTGNVSIGNMMSYSNSVSSITVSGGSLELKYELPKKPAYHFDAMADGVLTTEQYTPEGGAMRTNVTEWADVSGNNVTADFASCDAFDTAHPAGTTPSKRIFAAPTLRQIQTRTGIVRPMVDFGAVGGPNTGNKTGDYGKEDASGMLMSSTFTTLRELHAVTADSMSTKRQALFTSRTALYFYRNWDPAGAYFRPGYAAAVARNGVVELDGEKVGNPDSDVFPNGVHLASYMTAGNTTVDSLAYSQYGQYTGGLRIGEQLAFTSLLPAVAHTNLQRHLMRKWFGESYTVGGGTLSSLALADGATLTISGAYAPDVSVREISGSGAIEAGKVSGVESLTLSCAAGGAWDSLSVAGTLSFANDMTLYLNGYANAVPGEYVLVSAATLENADPSSWTVVYDAGSFRLRRIILDGNSIKLRILPKGATLSFR